MFEVVPEMYVVLSGEIDANLAQRLTSITSNAVNSKVQRIHILVNSGGGTTDDGVRLHNTLMNLPISITTYNMGSVGSAAVYVYLAGSKRFTCNPSRFIIHKPSFNMSGSHNHQSFISHAERLQSDWTLCVALLQDRTTMTTEMLIMSGADTAIISHDEAVNVGIVHDIGVFAPPTGSRLHNC